MILLEAEEVRELQRTLRFVQDMFPEELKCMGGIRGLLSDELLQKLGFTLSFVETDTKGELP